MERKSNSPMYRQAINVHSAVIKNPAALAEFSGKFGIIVAWQTAIGEARNAISGGGVRGQTIVARAKYFTGRNSGAIIVWWRPV